MRERAEKLTLPQPDSRGIIPQDEAFLSLPELDLTPFRKGGKKILEHYNVEQLCGYQVLKQADVVMRCCPQCRICFLRILFLKITGTTKNDVYMIPP